MMRMWAIIAPMDEAASEFDLTLQDTTPPASIVDDLGFAEEAAQYYGEGGRHHYETFIPPERGAISEQTVRALRALVSAPH